MKIRLCTIGQTEVRLHCAAFILAGYMIIAGRIGFFCTAMVSILLHEGAHALTASSLGYAPELVEITPLGAVMHLDEEASMPVSQRLVMLLSGPAMTLFLCAASLWGTSVGMIPLAVGRILFTANAGLLMINLLPCLPLDGGRLVMLLLETLFGAVRAAQIMRWISSLIGAVCVMLGVMITWQTGTLQFTLAACGCVVLYAAQNATATVAMTELRQWMARKTRLEQHGMAPVKTVVCMENVPLRRVIRMLPKRSFAEIWVLSSGTMRLMGKCTETELIAAYMDRPGAPIKELI